MIIVRLTGGLGNQLFQYAIGRKLALHHKTELVLENSFYINTPKKATPRKYELCHFNIKARCTTSEERAKLFLYTNSITKRIKRFFPSVGKFYFFTEQQLHKKIYLHLTKNSFLDGYWQSENFFTNIKKNIIEDLQIIPAMSANDIAIADKITSTNSISLHIRRGDYVSYAPANATHGLCGLDYYIKSISYIEQHIENPMFFIFSDDIKWVSEHLKINHPYLYVDHNSSDTAFQDLRLMSMCKHNIIANSSFSWWGAWLNQNQQKLVIAPKRWFANEQKDSSEIIPASWITL